MKNVALCVLSMLSVAAGCDYHNFQCYYNSIGDTKCIPQGIVCDGADDCWNGADEMNCGIQYGGCPNRYFGCLSGGCVPQEWLCNGVANCGDGSDELNCTKTYECPAGTFKCPYNKRCVHLERVCDGFDDCRDQTGRSSDEIDCPPRRTSNTNSMDTALANCSLQAASGEDSENDLVINCNVSNDTAETADLESTGVPDTAPPSSRILQALLNVKQVLQSSKQSDGRGLINYSTANQIPVHLNSIRVDSYNTYIEFKADV